MYNQKLHYVAENNVYISRKNVIYYISPKKISIIVTFWPRNCERSGTRSVHNLPKCNNYRYFLGEM